VSVARPSRRSDARGGWFEPPLPRVLAHRGLALDAPENTLAAFEAAVASGAAYLETDVHASLDDVGMVCHDPDLTRVAGVDAEVGELTVSELQRIDLGGGHRMPTLREALDSFPTALFNIDVKSDRAAAATARAVLDAGALDRVLITSFSSRRRAAAVRLLPGVRSSASAPRFVLILALAKLGVLHLVPWARRGVDAVQVPTHVGRVAISTPRVIRAIHRVGLEMHIWTVNTPEEMAELLTLGVDGVVTDRADIALAVVARSAQQAAR
jgi:glycerophosphoryl diester phosphodiesterase